MTVVEFCLRNVDATTRDRLADAAVEAYPKPCLQRCGDCRDGPMLVVDGDLVTGGDHEGLLGRVVDAGSATAGPDGGGTS